MSHNWDAEAYHRVSDPQFSWGQAVLARLPLRGDERVIDLGCGTGRLTRELALRLPHGEVIALDASRQMLEQAQTHLADCRPRVRFLQATLPAIPLASWADVVFSTATFHWVRDHPALFASIFRALRPGGTLYAQCGGGPNLAKARAPVRDIFRLPQFARWFRDWVPIWEFADDRITAERLAAAGFTGIETNLEPAPVKFSDEAAYRAFVTTVVFRLHLGKLPADLKKPFLDEVIARLPAGPDKLTLDYWRLNMTARRPA
jgi:trans-aconitate 2-methyltransferase